MATTTTLTYALTSAVVVSSSLTSLANNAAWQCGTVTNISNAYVDVLVQLKTKGLNTNTNNNIELYVAASIDATIPLTDFNTAAGDVLVTAAAGPFASRMMDSVQCVSALAMQYGPYSLQQLFGTVPARWSVIVKNVSGAALSATASDHVLTYQGIKILNT